MKEMKYSKATTITAKPSSQYHIQSQSLKKETMQNSNQIKINAAKSSYYSTSNSFRQANTKSSKVSPEKSKSNKYLNIIQSQNREDEIITECKELEENALELIKKKFISKKHTQQKSNYLNFTNPIYKANKIVINKKDLKMFSQGSKLNQLNSQSESINTSLTRMNCTKYE